MFRFFMRPGYMGWFGKIPSVGDFAGRGMPQSLQETVYEWISSGMAAFVESRPEDWKTAFQASPFWHFLVGAGVWDKSALVGCVAPSVDKVGRLSPLMVLRSFDKRQIAKVLPPDSRWLYRVDVALRNIIGERVALDDVHHLLAQLAEVEERRDSTAGILSELGIGESPGGRKETFAWPELSASFSERDKHCFWWTESSPQSPSRQIVHEGAPDRNLFCRLMDEKVPNG